MISSDDLTYFTELANILNFSRAAERIGISQPSLSAAIKRMEYTLGVPLFIRTKTGAILTPGGKELLANARQLQQLWGQVKLEAVSSHHDVQGSITLGCHTSVGLYTLPKFLSHIIQKYPGLTIQLKHDISRKIVSEVINLTIDIGIVINPVPHPDLIIQKLYSDKMSFWTSAGKASPTQQLKSGQLVILCDPALAQSEWLLKQLEKNHIKRYRLVTSSSFELIAKLIVSGAGIGILPESIAKSTLPGKLKLVPNMPTYEDEACIIFRPENRDIKAIRVLVDTIKKYVS